MVFNMKRKKFLKVVGLIVIVSICFASCNLIKMVHFAKVLKKNQVTFNYRTKMKFIYKNGIYLPMKIGNEYDTVLLSVNSSNVLNKETDTSLLWKKTHTIVKRYRMRIPLSEEFVCNSTSCEIPSKKTKQKGEVAIYFQPCDLELPICKHESTAALIMYENFGSGWKRNSCENANRWEIDISGLLSDSNFSKETIAINFSDSTIMLIDSLKQEDTIGYKSYNCTFLGIGAANNCTNIPRMRMTLNGKEQYICLNINSQYFFTFPKITYTPSSKDIVFDKVTDGEIYGLLNDTCFIKEYQFIDINGLVSEFFPVKYETGVHHFEVGLPFISHFDWIIDEKNNQIYCKQIKSFTTKELNINPYKTEIVNNELRIIQKALNSQYSIYSIIKSVNGEAITAENICDYKKKLNNTNDWSKLELEVELPQEKEEIPIPEEPQNTKKSKKEKKK